MLTFGSLLCGLWFIAACAPGSDDTDASGSAPEVSIDPADPLLSDGADTTTDANSDTDGSSPDTASDTATYAWNPEVHPKPGRVYKFDIHGVGRRQFEVLYVHLPTQEHVSHGEP